MTATTTNEVCIASLLEYFYLVGWIDLCWQGMKIWWGGSTWEERAWVWGTNLLLYFWCILGQNLKSKSHCLSFSEWDCPISLVKSWQWGIKIAVAKKDMKKWCMLLKVALERLHLKHSDFRLLYTSWFLLSFICLWPVYEISSLIEAILFEILVKSTEYC